MVRASWDLGSEEMADSQDATLDSVRAPLVDLGVEDMSREAISVDNMAKVRFSFSTTGITAGLDAEDPIVYV